MDEKPKQYVDVVDSEPGVPNDVVSAVSEVSSADAYPVVSASSSVGNEPVIDSKVQAASGSFEGNDTGVAVLTPPPDSPPPDADNAAENKAEEVWLVPQDADLAEHTRAASAPSSPDLKVEESNASLPPQDAQMPSKETSTPSAYSQEEAPATVPVVRKADNYDMATPPPDPHDVGAPDEEFAAAVPPKVSKSEFTDDANVKGTKNSVVTIQHNIETTQQPRSNWGVLGGFFASMSKPMVALIMIMTLGGIATWAFFFSQFLRIPGLEEQVDRLEVEVDMLEIQVDELEMEVDRLTVQVDRLSNEVDRLEGENDRFEELNDELTAANEVFAGLIIDLEESNAEFQAQNEQLNASVTELEAQNEQLADSNEEYRSLNEQLNATNEALNAEIDELREITANLTSTNEQLQQQNQILQNETEYLANLTVQLNNTVTDLANNVSALEAQNEELRGLVDDLSTIVSFLNETASDGNETFEEIAAFLAEQISANRALLLGVLQNTYVQTVQTWDCNLFDTFAGEPFIEDLDSPIGATSYPDVIAEVDTLALIPICLDLDDLESYLANEVVGDGNAPPVDISMNQLVSGVNMYLTDALNYYFPDTNEPGLTQEDWVAAEYDCVNLPDDLRYRYQ